MRFLITMNMPSASGNLVHQVTVDHEAESLEKFSDLLNNEIFIVCRNLYRRTDNEGAMYWEDRGDIILNSAHVGKVQEYIEQDRGWQSDESQGSVERRGFSVETKRGPIRPRRTVL